MTYQVDPRHHCFLCGASDQAVTLTREHVFPKWLENKFGLWNLDFAILNGTRISYRQIVVPCCSRCNSDYLARLEARVKDAYSRGFEGFQELVPSDLFLWLAKIYFGATYKQVFLNVDRTDPDSGPIVTGEDLERYELHRSLLQGILGKTAWHEFPASIFLFRTKPHAIPANSFDYRDSVLFPFVAIRMGSVGIVAFLQDWGLMHQAGGDRDFLRVALDAARSIDLHPAQFAEIAARFHSAGRFLTNAPSVFTFRDESDSSVVAPMRPSEPAFDGFTLDQYARDLAWYLHLKDEDLVYEAGEVITLLFGPDGEPLDVPIGAYFHGVDRERLPIPW